MKSSAPSASPPLATIIIDQCPTMLIPSTLNKCTPTAVTPPPRYRAPKRHFLPAPPTRAPPQLSMPQSSQGQAARVPSRLETEPLISLLFQSEGHSPIVPPPLRPNRQVPPPLTRTERIMLRPPSPSRQFLRTPRRARLRHLFQFPRDLSLVTSLGLIALIAGCALGLIQIGNATAQKTCPPSGGRSRPSSDTIQHITDDTPVGSVSQG